MVHINSKGKISYYNPEYNKNWYLRNKERMKSYYKSRYKEESYSNKIKNTRIRILSEQKSFIFTNLGHVCCKCGFSDKRALQIDHINGDGYTSKIINKTGSMCRRTNYYEVIESIKKNENRFQILCANCNWIKRVENEEHKKRGDDVNKIRIKNKQEPSLFSF